MVVDASTLVGELPREREHKLLASPHLHLYCPDLANSIAGLAGNYSSVQNLPSVIPVWALAAGIGSLIGSEFGSRRLQSNDIRRALAAVLVISGLKLMLT